ncbi:MAG TPA: hypothetical protein VFI70_07680, partial [Nitrososphaeraceae archaeon]|nr:hypothetical protein [Nitrososphaeraceae archaeon]
DEKEDMKIRHKQELALKDNQIEQSKLQNDKDIEEKIQQAINYYEQKQQEEYRQKETQNELQLLRIKEENQSLLNQVEKMKKTLDNVPPELIGTAGEIILLDHLCNAFPKDELIPKKVGVEMAEIIQTIVTERGEKITPPIVWDRKMSDSVTTFDINKAKKIQNHS